MLKINQSKLRGVGVIVLGIMFMGLQVFVVDAVRAEQSQMDVLVELFGDKFVSADEVAAAIAQGLIGEISAGPNDADLVFTPVKPCRIYDSRKPALSVACLIRVTAASFMSMEPATLPIRAATHPAVPRRKASRRRFTSM